jgi:hypothetical protein
MDHDSNTLLDRATKWFRTGHRSFFRRSTDASLYLDSQLIPVRTRALGDADGPSSEESVPDQAEPARPQPITHRVKLTPG